MNKHEQRLAFIDAFMDESDRLFKQAWKAEFCRGVMGLFYKKDKITTKDLVGCAEKMGKSDKSAKNAWKEFVDNFDTHKNKFERYLNNPELCTELQHYPLIERIGRGNEALCFRIVGENEREQKSLDDISTDTVKSLPISTEVLGATLSTHDVIYTASKLENPPYWFTWIRPFFGSWHRRFTLLLICVFCMAVIPVIVGIGISLVSHNFGYVLVASFIAGVLMSLVISPLQKTYEVIDKKICLLDSIKSKLLISEPKPNQYAKSAVRDVFAYHVEANCPICVSKYHLRNSIQLEKKRIHKIKRVVGICNNNPVEHRFTFDKDTLKGVSIS